MEPEPAAEDDARSMEDDAQNMMKMFELSDKFVAGKDGGDLDIMDNPLERKYVREGKLKKNGNERMLFLFSDVLVLTKEQTKKGDTKYEVRRVIPLHAALLRTQRHHVKPKERLAFEVTVPDDAPGKRYTADFTASNEDDRDAWLRDLKEQVMALAERAEMRGDESPHGRAESLCSYGGHHRLLGGTLSHAALMGDCDMVRRVRDESPEEFGALVGEQDEYGVTALHVAAFAGDVEMVHEIMDAESVKPLLRRLGAERDRDGLTLACQVARNGHSSVIAALATASEVMDGLHAVPVPSSSGSSPVFDLNAADAAGVAPLEHAVQNQQDDAAFALRNYTTNPHHTMITRNASEKLVLFLQWTRVWRWTLLAMRG